MNNGGDAAEQVIRLYLDGFECVARLSGSAAKNVGALLMSVAKQEHKTKGKARLTSMLKSGKPLKVFSIPQRDLETFSKQAKNYGVLYTILRDKTNNSPTADVDILVRAEDASKIQRIVDRFEIGKVDKAAIVNESEKKITDREGTDREEPKKSRGQRIYEEAMGIDSQKEKNSPENPTAAKTEKSPPSRQRSEQQGSRTDKGRVDAAGSRKPSVKKELERYKRQSRRLQYSERRSPQQQRENLPDKNRQTVHKQPANRKHYKER